MAGVLVLVQGGGAETPPATIELIVAGRRVADELGAAPLTALVAGKDVAGMASALGQYGVERVLVAEDPSPAPLSPAWLLAAAQQAATEVAPDVVLLSHIAAGRELGPSLAARLNTGIVTDCTGLRVADGLLVMTKPVFGGSAVAEMAVTGTPQMATLRPRAFASDAAPTPRQAVVETLATAADPAAEGVEVLEEVQAQTGAGPRLKDAKVIVAGGRGIGSAENWHYVEELADVLGAAVGASRAVTDAGWVPPSLQVGLTGATVAPDLYVTVGISGAVQHVAGISGARNVVAINRDGDANIFKYARYGVVGDWKQIVPALTQRLRELRV